MTLLALAARAGAHWVAGIVEFGAGFVLDRLAPKLDAVIRSRNEMMRFLRQSPSDVSTVAETIRQMGTLADLIP